MALKEQTLDDMARVGLSPDIIAKYSNDLVILLDKTSQMVDHADRDFYFSYLAEDCYHFYGDLAAEVANLLNSLKQLKQRYA